LSAVKKVRHAVQPADIKRDVALRKLIDIHVSKKSHNPNPTSDRSILYPALTTEYKDLHNIRYQFPVVLVENQSGKTVESLSVIVDQFLKQLPSDDNLNEGLKKDVYKLESAVKKVVAQTPDKRLSDLWTVASETLTETYKHDDAGKQALQSNLGKSRQILEHDGLVISCDTTTPLTVFTHAWNLLLKEQTDAINKLLDNLVQEIMEIQQADRAKSSRERRPAALRAAMGKQESVGIDFKAMSAILQKRGRGRRLSKKRRERIDSVVSVLHSARQFFEKSENKKTGDTEEDAFSFYCQNCSEALEKFSSIQEKMIEIFKAIRVAALEVENQYYSSQHDAFFADFNADDITEAEYRSFPPFLVCINSANLDAVEKSTLIDILSSNLPIKVLLSLERLGDEPGLDSYNGWNAQLANMALSLSNAFVLQSAGSHLVTIADKITAGLKYNGPALFHIYSGSLDNFSRYPLYLVCAAAIESRAFTGFVYDPSKGKDLAQRLTLDCNPQPEKNWPEHVFSYEDADGQAISETTSFTFIDFLAIDPKFSGYFVPVPESDWHENMLPVDDYLQLAKQDTAGWIPYILMVDGNNLLHRVVVKRSLLTFARKCLANWHNLQELGGISNSHVNKLLEIEKQHRKEELQQQAEAVESDQSGSSDPLIPVKTDTAPESATTSVIASAAEQETGVSSDNAYIETPRCTSCNDCTDRNDRLFSYDEAKQAYIKDITAGTFREIVEAAENCPVCIIHPGKPLNPDEPGLDDLIVRAEALN